MNKATPNRNCTKNKNKEPELNKQMINAIKKAREQIQKGKFISLEAAKKRLKL